MNSFATPALKTEAEFHHWCLQKRPEEKLTALLGNWEAIIGGPCNLKPVEFKLSNGGQQGVIFFETESDEQHVSVRSLQSFYQRAISNSNLQTPPAPAEGVILIGGDHGYLTTLIGVVSQNRHLFGG